MGTRHWGRILGLLEQMDGEEWVSWMLSYLQGNEQFNEQQIPVRYHKSFRQDIPSTNLGRVGRAMADNSRWVI